MSHVLDALGRWAAIYPHRPALLGEEQRLGYGALHAEVMDCAAWLSGMDVRALAVALDNGPAWAVLDLATVALGIALVPLPRFFTPAQGAHVLRASGATHLACDMRGVSAFTPGDAPARQRTVAGTACLVHELRPAAAPPAGAARVTFTSGTSGSPRGVCLSPEALEQVCLSLVEALEVTAADRHLSLLPLSLLLENLGGLWTPVLAGATACLPSQESVGMHGSSGFDAVRAVRGIEASRPTTLITVPHVLDRLAAAWSPASPAPASLRFVAVGGAPVSLALLQRAERVGLPVYQGYGLSECGSVVAVNTPRHNRPGSTGRVLPHARVSVAEDGEIHVGGALFQGYVGDPADGKAVTAPWPTGDTGRLDDDGFLFVTGRRTSTLVTAFGRNVAPEWVEAELLAEPAIAQAAVFGHGKPRIAAVVVPAGADHSRLVAAIARANRRLPDYGRVAGWVVAEEPFTPANGQLSAGGALRRGQIAVAYGPHLDTILNGDETSWGSSKS